MTTAGDVTVWINSNEIAIDGDNLFYDVEVLVDAKNCKTVLFECQDKEAAVKLKKAIEKYAISVMEN